MAIKPVICKEDAPFIPECNPCDDFEERVEALEECCDEARDTLSDHEQRITTNEADISALQTNLADNYYTKGEVDNRDSDIRQNFNNYYTKPEIDTKEQAINNNFSNYYTKSQVYTQSQVDSLLSQVPGSKYVEVSSLPTTGEAQTIYLLDIPGTSTKEQWIYSNSTWVKIGDTSVDMSQYVRKNELADAIHPVGDVMIRTDNIDPATLYTGTTWQKISEGQVLIGANSTYPLGSSANGSMTHNHTNPTTNDSSAANTGGTTLTAAQSGNQAQTITSGGMSGNSSKTGYFDTRRWQSGTNLGHTLTGSSGIVSNTGDVGSTDHPINGVTPAPTKVANQRTTVSFDVSHTHSVSVAAKNATSAHSHTMAHTHTQGNTGDATIPYLAVNIWIRTA